MNIQSCGIRVHAEQLGDGEQHVLLLHGWGCSIDLMRPVAERLDNCTALMLDFPGFGGSEHPKEAWGVPEYAACLTDVLHQLHFTPCTVIAHSFGCRVALYLAAQQPRLFDKLVLTGAAGLRKEASAAQKQKQKTYQTYKKWALALGRLPLMKPAADALMDRLRRRFGSADYNALSADMRATFVKVVNLDLSDCLPKVQVPTLLLFGDRDTETPLWMGQRMEKEIPDAGLVVLEGGTHFAYLEQLDRFAAIVRTFLKGA